MIAARRLAELRLSQQTGTKLADIEDLGVFIERASAGPAWAYGSLENPKHLAKLLNVFDRVERGERVRVLLSAPPQHGKTASELYGAVRHMLRHPSHKIVFATYAQSIARARSSDTQAIAKKAGVKLVTHGVDRWRTAERGEFIATSHGGPLTGEPDVKLAIVDDPYSGRADAESRVIREKIFDWANGTLIARAAPDTSILVTHTRWVEDDLIGRLSRQTHEDGSLMWEHINIPAINDAGEALWPIRHGKPYRDLAFLEEHRRGSEYDWWSMWMGSPRPRGGALFQDVHYYERLPDGYRVAIGIDLAYTAKTHADWSVAVVLAESGGLYYVIDVLRLQVGATLFGERLKLLLSKYQAAKMDAYVYGPEKGNIDWLRKEGLPIRATQKPGDKFVRAQPAASAWNRGKILLPRTRGAVERDLPERIASMAPEWLEPFVSELASFTGVNDVWDDQVDALAPAYDRLARQAHNDAAPRAGGVGGGPSSSFDDTPVGI